MADMAEWVLSITRTVLDEHWRRYYGRGAVLPFGDGGKSEQVEESGLGAVWDESDGLVQRVLARLPEADRQVLELRLLRRYSIQETAQELGVPPEQISIIQRRALRKAAQIAEGVT